MSAPRDLPSLPTRLEGWEVPLAGLHSTAEAAYAAECCSWLENRLCEREHRDSGIDVTKAGEALAYLMIKMPRELLEIAQTMASLGGPAPLGSPDLIKAAADAMRGCVGVGNEALNGMARLAVQAVLREQQARARPERGSKAGPAEDPYKGAPALLFDLVEKVLGGPRLLSVEVLANLGADAVQIVRRDRDRANVSGAFKYDSAAHADAVGGL